MTSLKGPEYVASLFEYLNRRNLILSYLEEDIGSGDITSELVLPRGFYAEAEVWYKVPQKTQLFVVLRKPAWHWKFAAVIQRNSSKMEIL